MEYILFMPATQTTETEFDFNVFESPVSTVAVVVTRGAAEGSTEHWNNVKAVKTALKAARTARHGKDES